MSVLALTQNFKAIAPGLTASFLGTGGTPPYTYTVRPLGAGGVIDPNLGIYTAPTLMNGGQYVSPKQLFDTIQLADNAGGIVTSQILVGNALFLFCDIIQTCLGLSNGRVYLWDQKMGQPTDAGLYVAVSMLQCKPIGNVNSFDGSGSNTNSDQFVSMWAQLQVDIISRDTEARDRKEEILMALDSDYSRLQQSANSFYIGKMPPGSQFVNLSSQDGAAIPYRYNIAVAMQYAVSKVVPVGSFITFSTPQLNSNP